MVIALTDDQGRPTGYDSAVPAQPEKEQGERSILVTGGAGFIGSHVVEALLRRGDRTTAIDNFDDAYDPAVKIRNLAGVASHPRFSLFDGDIRDDVALARVLAQGPFDGIIHLAARAGVRASVQDPILFHDVNVGGTVNLLEHVKHMPMRHFVLGSSSSVYGATSSPPFREDEAADRPSSPYAATKRSNELACYAFHHLYGFPVTCLRFFTVYGPRQRPEMAIHKFARLIHQGKTVDIYGDGTSHRDYTFIDDIVDGILRALDRPSGYRIFNLGTAATISLSTVVSTLCELLQNPSPRIRHLPDEPGDVPGTVADISAAHEELGYQPKIPIEAGLPRFVSWFLEHQG